MATKDPFDDLPLNNDLKGLDDLDKLDSKLDEDFDFGEDVDDSSRKPVEEQPGIRHKLKAGAAIIASGLVNGIKHKIDYALPNTASLASEALNFASEATSLRDEFRSNLDPTINQIKLASRRIATRMKDRGAISESLYDKTKKWTEVEDRGGNGPSKEDGQSFAIRESIKSIFEAESQERALSRQEGRVDKFIDRQLEYTNNQNLADVLGDIRLQTLHLTQFFSGTYTGYLKKSLELKYKHIFLAEDTLAVLRLGMQSTETRLDAIRHNSALPDIQKEREMETLRALTRDKILGSISQHITTFGGKVLKNIKSNILSPITDMAGMLGDTIETTDSMMDMEDEMNQMTGGKPQSLKYKAAMSLLKAAGWGGGMWLGNKAYQKISPHMEGAEDLMATMPARMVMMADQIAQEGISTEGPLSAGSPLQMLLASIIPALDRSAGRVDNQFLVKPDDKTSFDVATRTSIVEIMPGYLAKILQQVTNLATGTSNEEQVFDPQLRDFVSASKFQALAMDRLLGDKQMRTGAVSGSLQKLKTIYLAKGSPYQKETKALDFDNLKDQLAKFSYNLAQQKRFYLDWPDQVKTLAENKGDLTKAPRVIKDLFKGIKDVGPVAEILAASLFKEDGSLDLDARAAYERQVIEYMTFALDRHKDQLNKVVNGHGQSRYFKGMFEGSQYGRLNVNANLLQEQMTTLDETTYQRADAHDWAINQYRDLEADKKKTNQIIQAVFNAKLRHALSKNVLNKTRNKLIHAITPILKRLGIPTRWLENLLAKPEVELTPYDEETLDKLSQAGINLRGYREVLRQETREDFARTTPTYKDRREAAARGETLTIHPEPTIVDTAESPLEAEQDHVPTVAQLLKQQAKQAVDTIQQSKPYQASKDALTDLYNRANQTETGQAVLADVKTVQTAVQSALKSIPHADVLKEQWNQHLANQGRSTAWTDQVAQAATDIKDKVTDKASGIIDQVKEGKVPTEITQLGQAISEPFQKSKTVAYLQDQAKKAVDTALDTKLGQQATSVATTAKTSMEKTATDINDRYLSSHDGTRSLGDRLDTLVEDIHHVVENTSKQTQAIVDELKQGKVPTVVQPVVDRVQQVTGQVQANPTVQSVQSQVQSVLESKTGQAVQQTIQKAVDTANAKTHELSEAVKSGQVKADLSDFSTVLIEQARKVINDTVTTTQTAAKRLSLDESDKKTIPTPQGTDNVIQDSQAALQAKAATTKTDTAIEDKKLSIGQYQSELLKQIVDNTQGILDTLPTISGTGVIGADTTRPKRSGKRRMSFLQKISQSTMDMALAPAYGAAALAGGITSAFKSYIDVFRSDDLEHPLIRKEQFRNRALPGGYGLMFANRKPVKSAYEITDEVFIRSSETDPKKWVRLVSEDDLNVGLVDEQGRALHRLTTQVGRAAHTLGKAGGELVGAVTGGIFGAYGRVLRTGAHTALDLLKGGVGKLRKTLDPYPDIYTLRKPPGKNNPTAYGKTIQEFGVFAQVGKEKPSKVMSCYDIDRPIIHSVTGEYLITEDHIKDGLIDRWGQSLTSKTPMLDGLLGKTFGLAKDTLGLLGGGAGGLLNWGANKAYEVVHDTFKAKNPYQDVYRKKDITATGLLVLAKDIRAGIITYADTGDVLKSCYDIDRPVMKNGQVVVEETDIEDGLVNIHGEKLNTWNKYKLAGKLSRGVIGLGFHTIKKITKFAGKAAGKLLKLGGEASLFGLQFFEGLQNILYSTFGDPRDRLTSKTLKTIVGDKLDAIYALLDTRMNKPIKGDTDHDGDRNGSLEDYEQQKKDRHVKSAETKSQSYLQRVKAGLGLGGNKDKEKEDDDSDNSWMSLIPEKWKNKALKYGGKAFGKLGKLGGGLLRGGGAVLRGAGSLITTGAGALASTGVGSAIASGASTALGATSAGLGAIGSGIATGASAAGSAIAAGATGLGSMLGAGGAALGTAIASNPIGWAVGGAALLAVGGYFAYKWLTSKSPVEQDLLKMRCEYYGVNSEAKGELIEKLEKKTMAITKGDDTPFNDSDVEAWAKEFDCFDKTNIQGSVGYWLTWYKQRFVPVFNTFVTVLNRMGVKYKDQDDLNEEQQKATHEVMAKYVKSKVAEVASLVPTLAAFNATEKQKKKKEEDPNADKTKKPEVENEIAKNDKKTKTNTEKYQQDADAARIAHEQAEAKKKEAQNKQKEKDQQKQPANVPGGPIAKAAADQIGKEGAAANQTTANTQIHKSILPGNRLPEVAKLMQLSAHEREAIQGGGAKQIPASMSLSGPSTSVNAKAAKTITEPVPATQAPTVGATKTTPTAKGKATSINDQSAKDLSGPDGYVFGKQSFKMEAGGNPGMVSTGKGDKGGISYGIYQFASKAGIPQQFIKSAEAGEYGKQLAAAGPVNSPAFIAKWKELGKDPGFEKAQDAFGKKMYLTQPLKKYPWLANRSPMVQEAFMHANMGSPRQGRNLMKIVTAAGGEKLSDKEILQVIDKAYQDNIGNTKGFWQGYSKKTLNAMRKKYAKQQSVLMAAQDKYDAKKASTTSNDQASNQATPTTPNNQSSDTTSANTKASQAFQGKGGQFGGAGASGSTDSPTSERPTVSAPKPTDSVVADFNKVTKDKYQLPATPTNPNQQAAATVTPPSPAIAPAHSEVGKAATVSAGASSDSWQDGFNKVKLANSEVDIKNLHPVLKKALGGLNAEFMEKFGSPLQVNSGYRSPSKQKALYEKYGPSRAAKPNPRAPHMYSMGGTPAAIAFDANSSQLAKADKAGLLAKYGLDRPLLNGKGRVKPEKWHVQLAGVTADNAASLESGPTEPSQKELDDKPKVADLGSGVPSINDQAANAVTATTASAGGDTTGDGSTISQDSPTSTASSTETDSTNKNTPDTKKTTEPSLATAHDQPTATSPLDATIASAHEAFNTMSSMLPTLNSNNKQLTTDQQVLPANQSPIEAKAQIGTETTAATMAADTKNQQLELILSALTGMAKDIGTVAGWGLGDQMGKLIETTSNNNNQSAAKTDPQPASVPASNSTADDGGSNKTMANKAAPAHVPAADKWNVSSPVIPVGVRRPNSSIA